MRFHAQTAGVSLTAQQPELNIVRTAIEALERRGPVQLTIETCSIHDFDLPEKRPVDVSMKPDRPFAETGLRLRTAGESCRILAESLSVSN